MENKNRLLLFFIFGLFILSGCINETNSNQNNQNTSTTIHKIYVNPLPSDVDNKYGNSIREATSFWEKEIDSTVFQETQNSVEADIIVDWVKEFGTGSIGHITNQKFIQVSLGDSKCLGKWRAYTYDTVLTIAEHELGHSLGAPDRYDDPKYIMYYQIPTQYDTQIDESEIIPVDYYRAYPLACSSKDTANFTINVQVLEGNPITVRVLPTKNDYDLFISGKEFYEYPDCSSEKVLSYNKNCTVPSTAYVALENSSEYGNNATKFRLTIKEN